jgi:hypothetical protein
LVAEYELLERYFQKVSLLQVLIDEIGEDKKLASQMVLKLVDPNKRNPDPYKVWLNVYGKKYLHLKATDIL